MPLYKPKTSKLPKTISKKLIVKREKNKEQRQKNKENREEKIEKRKQRRENREEKIEKRKQRRENREEKIEKSNTQFLSLQKLNFQTQRLKSLLFILYSIF